MILNRISSIRASVAIGSPFLLQTWVVSLGNASYSEGELSKASKQYLSLRPSLPMPDAVCGQHGNFEREWRSLKAPEG